MFSSRFIVALAMLMVLVGSLHAADFECQDGVPYKENYCNYCACGKGSLVCTFMLCPNVEVPPCEAGSEYKLACNTCYCTEEYGTICTDYRCEK